MAYGLHLPFPANLGGWLRRMLGLPARWSFRRWRTASDAAWVRSEKFFDVQRVERLAQAIHACAQQNTRHPVRPVQVQLAGAASDYVLAHQGRSVALRPMG
jgi:hypothetical protein